MKSPLGLLLAAAIMATTVRADSALQRDLYAAPGPKAAPVYTEDRISLELAAGPAFSNVGIGPQDGPDLNYALTNLRLGWVLNTPSGTGAWFEGCFQALLELSVAPVFEGSGHIIVGPTGLIRYNFVQPGAHLIPYLQTGVGIVYNDVYKDHDQDEVGQAIEFTPQASIGLKYLIGDDWAVGGEFIYHHISNASMNERNDGINSLGGLISVSYHFDRLWK